MTWPGGTLERGISKRGSTLPRSSRRLFKRLKPTDGAWDSRHRGYGRGQVGRYAPGRTCTVHINAGSPSPTGGKGPENNRFIYGF